MITNKKLLGLGLIKLKDTVEPSALLLKDLFERMYTFNLMWIRKKIQNDFKLVHPVF